MAPSGSAVEGRIGEILAQVGTPVPHVAAWFSLGVFALVLCLLWRDQRRPDAAWWRVHRRRRW